MTNKYILDSVRTLGVAYENAYKPTQIYTYHKRTDYVKHFIHYSIFKCYHYSC